MTVEAVTLNYVSDTGIPAQKGGDWDNDILRLWHLLFDRAGGSSHQVLPSRYGPSLSKYFESICYQFYQSCDP